MCKIKQPTSPTVLGAPAKGAPATEALFSLGKRAFLNFDNDTTTASVEPPRKIPALSNNNSSITHIFKTLADEQSITFAIRNSDDALFRQLLENPTTDIDQCDPHIGNSPLHFAVFHNKMKYVCALVGKQANLNIVNQHGITPLLSAIDKGHTAIAKYLIKHNANVSLPDKQGFTALHKAVLAGNVELLQYIIDFGSQQLADFSVDSASFEQRLTALHQAAYHGRLSAVKVLVAAGANVNAKSFSNTSPLHMAAVKNHAKVIHYLITKGALVNEKDNHQRTPLHYAFIYGHVSASRTLIDADSSLVMGDFQNQTCVALAARQGFEELMELIQSSSVA